MAQPEPFLLALRPGAPRRHSGPARDIAAISRRCRIADRAEPERFHADPGLLLRRLVVHPEAIVSSRLSVIRTFALNSAWLAHVLELDGEGPWRGPHQLGDPGHVGVIGRVATLAVAAYDHGRWLLMEARNSCIALPIELVTGMRMAGADVRLGPSRFRRMVRPSGTEAPGARRCGQADVYDELRARVSSWPPLRLARLR